MIEMSCTLEKQHQVVAEVELVRRITLSNRLRQSSLGSTFEGNL